MTPRGKGAADHAALFRPAPLSHDSPVIGAKEVADHEHVYVVIFVFWPCVVLLCAGINMLVSWTFSWSELIFDYLAGVLASYFLFAGASPDAGAAETFFSNGRESRTAGRGVQRLGYPRG